MDIPIRSWLPRSVREDAGFDAAESTGLFVGVRDFADDKLREVPYAVDDAVDLAHLFTFELELIPASRVVLGLAGEPQKDASKTRLRTLVDAGAVREPGRLGEIYEHLERQSRDAGENGLFVAAFASHGVHHQSGDFLLASHSRLRFVHRTGLAVTDVLDVAALSPSPRRLVFFDACRERLAMTRGGDGTAMDASFAQAIAEAEGQAVLAGATAGGFAYDDFERKNGVFSAAVIEGLRGAAPADERGFITVSSLAEYVSDEVRRWVDVNRPDLVGRTKGIEKTVDGVVESMPLAVDAERFEKLAAYRGRLEKARELLYGSCRPGSLLTGAKADEIVQVLVVERLGRAEAELLERVEALDGADLRSEHLVLYFDRHRDGYGGEPRASSSGTSRVRTDSELGIEFVDIEPGEFWMGSPEDEIGREDTEKRHLVRLTQGFAMATTPVTQGQFGKFVEETGYQTEAEREGWSWAWDGEEWGKEKGASWRDSGGSEHPVTHVSWNDAQKFCQWLSGRIAGVRLPTEAEWEYAARAGTETATYRGDFGAEAGKAPVLEEIAWYAENSGMQAHPVAKQEPNGWGLYDMLGNLWEWVADWYEEEYSAGPVNDPQGPERGSSRVIRGGAWSSRAASCRAANRGRLAPEARYGSVGFRLVRTYT